MLKCFFVVLCAFCAQGRLRPEVVPTLYRLNLDLTSGLDNSSNSYTGSNAMTLNVTTNVQNFTFHASGLRIVNTSLTYNLNLGSNFQQMDTEHNRSVNEESVTISSGNLPTGSYTLVVYFEGKFQPSLEGFYKSSYVSNKTTRWMASTHFETQGARKAFPCFDEPAMRTKLVLELTLPSDLHAVSNMPVFNSTMIENSKKRIVFAESPAMPTYLMAWFVGDATFDALYSSNSNGIMYSVYGNVDLRSQGEYASNVTPSVIAGLESFTGVTYVSSGMSQVGQAAIPDFSAGAMENWGLVTYREAYLLYDVVASSVLDKQHILMVIAHELAHQWFGDAVTLDWWSYTWLNEGFARYLQYVVPNKLEPNWMIENQFLTDVFQLSMTADLDSHPLTNLNVTSMDESEDMFDVVTYGKGASILRMFSSILGEESFKQWLNAYLNRVIQRGRVATPDDLFATLPDATLAEKFRPWTELAGHPVVNVSHINGSFLRLSQVKEDLTGSRSPTGLQVPIQVFSGASNPSISFVPLAGTDSPNASNSAYNYSVQSLNSSQEDIWLGQETLDLRFNSTLSGWYLFNANSTGYYRVLYDEANWKALRSAISRDELTEPLVRAQLISDALTLMKTGYLRPQVALDFARFLEAEKDLLVWKAALMAFKSIRDHLLEWTDARDALDTFVKNTMDKALKINLVQNEGSHYEKVLLTYIAKQACVYHINLCTSLQLLPKDNLTLIESVDRDTDGAAFCELTKNDWGLWDKLFSMYTSSLVPTQKARYLTSLTCTVNSTLQSRLLGYLLQPDIIKLQDFTATFTRICDTKNGIASAMNFIRTNATSFVSRVSSKRNVRKMLDAMSSKLYTNGMFKEMEDLMSQTPVLGLTGEEKSQLFSKARKSAGRRRIVAERVCEGFELTCVPVADPMPTEDVNRATGVAGSLGLLLAAIALYAL